MLNYQFVKSPSSPAFTASHVDQLKLPSNNEEDYAVCLFFDWSICIHWYHLQYLKRCYYANSTF